MCPQWVWKHMARFSRCGEDIPMLRGSVALETGTGFRVEVEKMMDAYERLIPFLRNAFCRQLTLCLYMHAGPDSCYYVDAAKLLALFSLTHNSTRAGVLEVKTAVVMSDLILGKLLARFHVNALPLA